MIDLQVGQWWRFRRNPDGLHYSVLELRPGGCIMVAEDDRNLRTPFKTGFIAEQMEMVDGPPDRTKPEPPPQMFEIGAPVRLKGNSPNDPIMTVIDLRWDSVMRDKLYEVFVAYVPVYGPEGKIVRDSFPPQALHVLPARPVVPAEET